MKTHASSLFGLLALGGVLAIIYWFEVPKLPSTPNPPHYRPTFPNTITCKGISTRVFYKQEPGLLGAYYPSEHMITIIPGSPLNFEREILMHEILHCVSNPGLGVGIDMIMGVHPQKNPITLPSTLLSDDVWNEMIAPELLVTLQQSPKLQHYFFDEDY